MNKKNFKKKITVSLLAFSIIGLGVTTNVSAKNNSDTNWDFSTFGNKGTRYTDPREKQDTSKAYIKVNTYNGRSNDYIQAYLVDSNYADFSAREAKTITGSGEYSVTNWAYEDRGRVNVRMALYAPYRTFYSWSASGLWSPDSSKNYN